MPRVSFVLRLERSESTDGLLVGDIEDVQSGQRQAVRSFDDVALFCRTMMSEPTGAGPSPLPIRLVDGLDDATPV